MENDPNQRSYFRVHYPVGVRPVVDLAGERFEVTELSEGGLRLLVTARSIRDGHRMALAVPERFDQGGDVAFGTPKAAHLHCALSAGRTQLCL